MALVTAILSYDNNEEVAMCYDLFRKLTCDDVRMILGFPKSWTYDEFTINFRQI